MSTKTKEKDVLFVVNGFVVKGNTTYLVKDKPDGDAPSGFVAAGVSKLPSDGVDEVFQVRWVAVSPDGKQGNWDTGFYEYSPCYSGQDLADIRKEVKTRVANILTPYRQAIGNPTAFDLEDQKSIEDTIFSVYSGRIFNTANVMDRVTLYFALLAFQVAPKGDEGDSKYRAAAYILVDTTKDKKQADEKTSDLFKCIRIFSDLYRTNPDKLKHVFGWLNFQYAEGIDQNALETMFFNEIKSSPEKSRIFLSTVEEADTDEGFDKFSVHTELRNLFKKKSAKVSKSPNGTLFYGEQEIGADLKSAAANIVRNKDLNGIKVEILIEK
jgi:hypothetical protein